MKRFLLFIFLGMFTTLGMILGGNALADEGHLYWVTITNVTRGQVITPPVVVSHNDHFRLFTLGEPAIPELVTLAEDGPTGDLVGLLGTLPSVHDVTAHTGPLLPGASVTLEIMTRGKSDRITAVGMLAITNDAFFAIRGVPVSPSHEKIVYGMAYDAGSETNSESCIFIPGPPCGNPFVRDTASAEGFVHVHGGIHGLADLDPAAQDWRGNVAEIRIQRAP